MIFVLVEIKYIPDEKTTLIRVIVTPGYPRGALKTLKKTEL